jgi:hypothetical protein
MVVGKRRVVIFRFSRCLAFNKSSALDKRERLWVGGPHANYFALSDSDLSGL